MFRATSFAALTIGLLALGACSDAPTKKDVDKLDAELAGKGAEADPALTAALEDQIMVDPSLSNQANADSIRPADEPLQGPVPPEPKGDQLGGAVRGTGTATASVAKGTVTLAQLAQKQASVSKDKFAGCGLDVDYAMAWSTRLPGDLPLYPKARVVEAAGSNAGRCALRAVTYTTGSAPRAVIDHYVGAARRAGYSAEHKIESGTHVVAGTRGGEAYYAIFAEVAGGGTSVDFVANNGS